MEKIEKETDPLIGSPKAHKISQQWILVFLLVMLMAVAVASLLQLNGKQNALQSRLLQR